MIKMENLKGGIKYLMFFLISCSSSSERKTYEVIFKNNVSRAEIKFYSVSIEKGIEMDFINDNGEKYKTKLIKKKNGLYDENGEIIFPFDSTNIVLSKSYLRPFIYKNIRYIKKKNYSINGQNYTVYIFSQHNKKDDSCESYFVDGFGFIGFRGFEDMSFYSIDSIKSILPKDILEVERKVFSDSLFIYKIPSEIPPK